MARAFVAVRPPDAVLARSVRGRACRRCRARCPARGGPAASSGTSRCSSSATTSTSTRSPARWARSAWRTVTCGSGAAVRSRRAAGEGPLARRGRGRRAASRSSPAAVGVLLAPLGHEPEDRPFHAHLTLARLAARPTCGRGASPRRPRPGGGRVDRRRGPPLREQNPPRRCRVPAHATFPLVRVTRTPRMRSAKRARRSLPSNGCSSRPHAWNYTPVIRPPTLNQRSQLGPSVDSPA